STFGITSMYAGLRRQLPASLRLRMIVGTFFVPAYLIWASGLLKEAVGIGLLGVALGRLMLWLTDRRPSDALASGTAALGLTIVRPRRAAALVVGAGVWAVVRGEKRSQLVRRATLGLAISGLLVLFGSNLVLAELGELSEDLGSRQAA